MTLDQNKNWAKEKGYEYWMAKALNTQGSSYFIKSDYDKALKLYQKSLFMKFPKISRDPGWL